MPRHQIPENCKVELFPDSNPMKIKYNDFFDMRRFYIALKEWFMENGWRDEEEGAEKWETYYSEQIRRDGVKETWWRWRPKKMAEGSNAMSFHIDVDVHAVPYKRTETIINGQKLTLEKGDFEVIVRAFIDEFYKREINDVGILKPFKTLFTKRWYVNEREQRQRELYQETYRLQNFIKGWFKMKRYLPYEHTQHFFDESTYPTQVRQKN